MTLTNSSNKLTETMRLGLEQTLFYIGASSLTTADQLSEFLKHKLNGEEIIELLEYMIQHDLIGEAQVNVNNTFGKIILYLTNQGRDLLFKINKLIATFTKSGLPDSKQLADAEFYLLKAESLLIYKEDFDILAVYSQPHLWRKFTRNQIENFGVSLGDELSLKDCDYLVVGRRWETDEIVALPTRIAIKCKTEQINLTSPEVVWFAASLRQKEKIESITGRKAVHIYPLGKNYDRDLNIWIAELFSAPKVKESVNRLNQIDDFVMEQFRQTKMTLCATDLAAFYAALTNSEEIDSKYFSQSLLKLSRLGLLELQTGKVKPGYKPGRPSNFYCLAGNKKFFKGKLLLRHIVLGYFCRKVLYQGWKFIKFYPNVPFLVMRDEAKAIRIFVSDYANDEHYEEIENTVRAFIKFDEKQNYFVQMVVVDYYRYFKLERKISSENLYNLCDDFDEYVD